MFNLSPQYYCHVQDLKIEIDPLHKYNMEYDRLIVTCHKDPNNLKPCSYCKDPEYKKKG